MRFARALATTALLAVVVVATPAAGPTPAGASTPTAAVALGDSFISGEGADGYQGVTNHLGITQTFQSWDENNKSAFYCHRSANASIHAAALPGIDDRFNLACSGGQPHDITNPSYDRTGGRWVDAQLDQLRAVAETHDIDVVLIGLGSNNSHFNFGELASGCIEGFLQDAWIGWWEFWAGPWNRNQDPCGSGDFPDHATMDAATAETIDAARQILTTLEQVDADGEHRVVFQDYTNPLPAEFASRYHSEDGRRDTRDKFRDLGRERYAAGCPVHRASLAPAAAFTAELGQLVQDTRDTLAAEFPGADLAYLDVQHAFDGARLCENDGSPANALATPVRFQQHPNGVFEDDMSGWNKLDLQDAADTCSSYYQTCQESLHPNADGHDILGQCLSAAATTSAPVVECARNTTTGTVTATEHEPSVSMTVNGTAIPKPGDQAIIDVWYSIHTENAGGATIESVSVDAFAYGPNAPNFSPRSTAYGSFRHHYECPQPGELAALPGLRVEATVDFAGETHTLSGRFDAGLEICTSTGFEPYR